MSFGHPGGMRRAGWLTACHRSVRRSGCAARTGPVERASAGDRRVPRYASVAEAGSRVAARRIRRRRDALTLSHAPARVTLPVGTASPGPPAAEGDSPAKQFVRNSPLEHPAPTPAGLVCARSLLENGIVRAKSQCGQFIRTHNGWVVRQLSITQASDPLGVNGPVVTNGSSQTMVTL